MARKHKGFWMNVDGEPVHMLADPNMTPETQAALEAMVRVVRERMDAATYDGLRVCEVCGDRECIAPATKCTQCRIQELIDNE